MSPTTQAATDQLINQAETKGNQLQQSYDTQSTQDQAKYNDTYSQAQNAYGNLQNFANNYGTNYAGDVNQFAKQAGYNPQTMQNSMNNATTLAETQANLPQAVNQMGNYSGATSGQVAQNYANEAPQIAGAVAGANTALQNQQNAYALGQTGANQALTGQGQSLQAALTGANQMMQTAAQTMTQIETLQQNQGYATAQQVAAYQGARNDYITAQANAETAAANMMNAQTNRSSYELTAQQDAQKNQTTALSGLNKAGAGDAWVGSDGNLWVKAAGLAGGAVNEGPANAQTMQSVMNSDPNLSQIANPSVPNSTNAAQALFNTSYGNSTAPFNFGNPSIAPAQSPSMNPFTQITQLFRGY